MAQSVWLHLVNHLGKIREPAVLAGWLATTTRRECGRLVRAAHGPRATVYALDAETMADEQSDTAEQEVLAAERHAALREAYTHLPTECQRLALHAHLGPAATVRRDQRQAGHARRQHRPDA